MNQESGISESWEDIDESEVGVSVICGQFSLKFSRKKDHNKKLPFSRF